jgi:hypothetical protein
MINYHSAFTSKDPLVTVITPNAEHSYQGPCAVLHYTKLPQKSCTFFEVKLIHRISVFFSSKVPAASTSQVCTTSRWNC